MQRYFFICLVLVITLIAEVQTSYYKSGSVRLQQNFENGKLNGHTCGFYEDGTRFFETEYVDGVASGISREYDERGDIIRVIEYSLGKKIAEVTFKENKKNGWFKQYYLNGKLKLEKEYKDDILDGLSKSYYKNGNLHVKMNMKLGLLHGISEEYYENKILKTETSYKNGLVDGVVKHFSPKGKLEAQLFYVKDKKNGTSLFYNENEKIAHEIIFSDDMVVKGYVYGKTGEKKIMSYEEVKAIGFQ